MNARTTELEATQSEEYKAGRLAVIRCGSIGQWTMHRRVTTHEGPREDYHTSDLGSGNSAVIDPPDEPCAVFATTEVREAMTIADELAKKWEACCRHGDPLTVPSHTTVLFSELPKKEVYEDETS